MKQLKLLLLFICSLSIWQIKAQTITVTPTVNWSCGNENISPSNYNFIAAQQSTFRSNQPAPTSGNWVIPVVVHVLFDVAHANDPAFNISYQQIQWQINQLNRGFQNLINPGSTPRNANTKIQFCLAQTSMGPNWTNNAERGVMRYQVPASTLSHTMDLAGQTTLLTLTHSSPTNFPFQNYLNIWLVDTITDLSGSIPNKNVIGYSNFPNTISGTNPLDGIVIRHDAFGSNNIPNHHNILISQLDKGNILTHEVGHYLNMLHTFEGGCVGTNSTTCLSQGDLICDTPPSTLTNINVCGGQNTCYDNLPAYSSDQLDMLENFMCYADDDCMVAFTIDQTAVMQGVLNTPWPAGRQDLTTTANLAATGLTNAGVNCCPTGVTTAYFTTTQTVCSAVSFSCIVPPVR